MDRLKEKTISDMKLVVYRKRFGSILQSENYKGRKRRGGYDTYSITRNEKGWYITHIVIGGQCNSRGEPYLFENLNHDSINYPEALGDYMDFLWRYSKNKNKKWIQQKLNVLSQWICYVEKKSPESQFWRMLK